MIHKLLSLPTSIKYTYSKPCLQKHNTIKHKVDVVSACGESGAQDREDEAFSTAGGTSDDDNVRSIQTIVPHELERVEEEDEDQIAKQEW